MDRFFVFFALLSLLLIGACTEDFDEWNEGNLQEFEQLGQSLEERGTFCQIVVGGGGKSEYIDVYLNPNGQYIKNTKKAWDFIRKTTGPCKFTIYNGKNLGGKHVTLGTDLHKRIRAGLDGVRYKDSGGGDTW